MIPADDPWTFIPVRYVGGLSSELGNAVARRLIIEEIPHQWHGRCAADRWNVLAAPEHHARVLEVIERERGRL